jgi:phosphatidylglycerophosphate synthase
VFLLFAISVNLTSYYIGFLSAVIIAREIWVGALRDFNARQQNTDATKVTFLAKIKTTTQLFTISTYLFGLAMDNMLIVLLADFMLFSSFLITVYTGFQYTSNTFKK